MMQIYCCECSTKVNAVLTNGKEIYPHRKDLFSLPFWICRDCNNFVGCHHKTKNRTAPLGCIPNQQIKDLRKKIHSILDPIWQEGKLSRREVYDILSKKTGRQYHTAFIRSVEEAYNIIKIIEGL